METNYILWFVVIIVFLLVLLSVLLNKLNSNYHNLGFFRKKTVFPTTPMSQYLVDESNNRRIIDNFLKDTRSYDPYIYDYDYYKTF